MDRLAGRAIALAALLTLWGPAAAAQQLPTGREIAQRINARDEGVTARRHVTMELVDRSGYTRTRETVLFRRYAKGADGSAGEKWIALFYLGPPTIKDTAFLTHDYLESKRQDEQWLYLPALRRTRRIGLRDRGKSFLGTDLSFDDVRNETKVTISDYTWKTLGTSEVDGHPCLTVEATPVDAETARLLGYSRVEFAVDREIWIVRKAEYEDLGGRHLKTSHQRDIRQIDGIWTPHAVTVTNHRTGHSTRFAYSEIAYGVSLPDDLFTERALRRGPPE